jgi:hypothetical protein
MLSNASAFQSHPPKATPAALVELPKPLLLDPYVRRMGSAACDCLASLILAHLFHEVLSSASLHFLHRARVIGKVSTTNAPRTDTIPTVKMGSSIQTTRAKTPHRHSIVEPASTHTTTDKAEHPHPASIRPPTKSRIDYTPAVHAVSGIPASSAHQKPEEQHITEHTIHKTVEKTREHHQHAPFQPKQQTPKRNRKTQHPGTAQ